MEAKPIAERASLLGMLAALTYCAQRWPRATMAVVIVLWVLFGSSPNPDDSGQ